MAYQDMTNWINGPNGIKFALGLDLNNEIVVLMKQPAKGIMYDVQVIRFKHSQPNNEHSPVIMEKNNIIDNELNILLEDGKISGN